MPPSRAKAMGADGDPTSSTAEKLPKLKALGARLLAHYKEEPRLGPVGRGPDLRARVDSPWSRIGGAGTMTSRLRLEMGGHSR